MVEVNIVITQGDIVLEFDLDRNLAKRKDNEGYKEFRNSKLNFFNCTYQTLKKFYGEEIANELMDKASSSQQSRRIVEGITLETCIDSPFN